MSATDTVLSNTVGFFWRAATGTVDPWTKNNLVEDETNNLVQASNGTLTPEQAKQQAESDVNTTLTTFKSSPDDSCAGADPTQFLSGLQCSLKKFENAIIVVLIIAIGVYLLGQYWGRKN